MKVETQYYTDKPKYIAVFNYYYSKYTEISMRVVDFEIKNVRYTDALRGMWKVKPKKNE